MSDRNVLDGNHEQVEYFTTLDNNPSSFISVHCSEVVVVDYRRHADPVISPVVLLSVVGNRIGSTLYNDGQCCKYVSLGQYYNQL